MGYGLMPSTCARSINWRNQTGASGAIPADFAPVRQLRQSLKGGRKVAQLAQRLSHARAVPSARITALRLRLDGDRASHRIRHLVTRRALEASIDIAHLSRMNTLATIQNQPKPAKERKVSKRVLHAIDLLVSGQCRTQKDAAEKVGLTRERLCRALKEDHVIGRLERAVKRQLAMSAAPAAGTLLNLLTEARSEHVRKDCATTILGMNGVHATGDRGPLVNIAVGGGPGYVLDLRIDQSRPGLSSVDEVGGVIMDDPAAHLIDVTPNREGER